MEKEKEKSKLKIIFIILSIIIIASIIIIMLNKKQKAEISSTLQSSDTETSSKLQPSDAQIYAIENVKRLKSTLNNPESLQLNSIEVYSLDGKLNLCIMDIGASNAFGGIVRKTYVYKNNSFYKEYESRDKAFYDLITYSDIDYKFTENISPANTMCYVNGEWTY